MLLKGSLWIYSCKTRLHHALLQTTSHSNPISASARWSSEGSPGDLSMFRGVREPGASGGAAQLFAICPTLTLLLRPGRLHFHTLTDGPTIAFSIGFQFLEKRSIIATVQVIPKTRAKIKKVAML